MNESNKLSGELPICSIIIRSFNEEKHIGNLIEGIKKQTLYDKVEIIVVDSGSTDSTVSISVAGGAKIVHIDPKDFSFGRAINVGCRVANGEFLLFASAHVYPLYTNWLEKMLKPFDDEKVALVYGRQVGNKATKYSEHQIFKKWFPEQSNYKQQIPFCNNANSVIRKSLWEIQPFDEVLTGLEDLDWGTRIEQKGYYIAYEAQAPIVHVHEETAAKIQNRYRREAIALKKIIPRQEFSFFDFIRLTISNICNDSFHAISDKVFFKNFWSIIEFRTMQFLGSYKGFKQAGLVNDQLKKRFYYPNDFKIKGTGKVEPGERITYSTIEN